MLSSNEIRTKRKIFGILQFLRCWSNPEDQMAVMNENLDDLSTIFPLICDISAKVCAIFSCLFKR